MRPGKRKTLQDFTWGKMLEKVEKIKASVRAKVEHPFHIIKNRFGLRKVRYRGLAKNTAHLYDPVWIGECSSTKNGWMRSTGLLRPEIENFRKKCIVHM